MMNLKTYRAPTMAEALAKVKRELGREAVIMGTRTVKAGGWLGLGARTIVEITASGDTNSLPSATRSGTLTVSSAARGKSIVAAAAGAVAAPRPAYRMTGGAESGQKALHQELADIKTLVQDLVKQGSQAQVAQWPDELRLAYVNLIKNHVAEELANEFIANIRRQCASGHDIRSSQVRELLVQQMAPILKPGCSITTDDVAGCKVVALVGPTGVGKTTTTAKLAAHFTLKAKKKVGLITIDTYRIAAVEQLRTYAKIINLPLEVSLTPQECKQALTRLQDCDLVLIDTAGRSQFDTLKLNELQEFLQAAKPHETHLVLSCNSHQEVLMNTIERFAPLGINRVIVSKLDEAVGMGVLLTVMQRLDAQLSYVTTGQDVPDDIEVSDGRRLAQWIINGPEHVNN